MTPFWPFTEQLPLGGRLRSWRMTHLDYRGEAGLGWQSGDRPGVAHHPTKPSREPGRDQEWVLRGGGAASPKSHAVPTPSLPPSGPLCQTKRFPAQPSCTAWPKPRNRSRLQPESLSLPLSRQVQQALGGQHHTEEASGTRPGGSPSLDQGLKERLGL